jgi:hypothetical protein
MENFQGMRSFRISRAIWERVLIFGFVVVDVPMLTSLFEVEPERRTNRRDDVQDFSTTTLLYRQVREPHRQGSFSFLSS